MKKDLTLKKAYSHCQKPKRYTKSYIFLVCTQLLLTMQLSSQNMGDYRSVSSGLWQTNTNWQQYNGVNWVAAASFPESSSTVSIEIQAADSICIPASYTFKLGNDLFVNGVLNLLGNLTCDSFKVKGNGRFRISGTSALLDIGDKFGLSTLSSEGSIRTSERFFGKNASYKFSFNNIQYTGNGLPDTVQNLYVNNVDSFIPESGLYLTKHLFIRDTLFFEKGRIFTDSLDARITMSALGAASGYEPTKFVNGPIRFIWQSNKLTRKFIPVGKDSLYRPIDVSYNHNNSNLNMYQYEFMNFGPHYTTIANSANYSYISEERYWKCGRIIGSSTINISSLGFSWGPSDGVHTIDDMKIGKGNDARTEWRRIQGTPSHTGTEQWGFVWVADNNPSTALDYILSSTIPFPNPYITLPVQLLNFDLTCLTKENWQLDIGITEVTNVSAFKIILRGSTSSDFLEIFYNIYENQYSIFRIVDELTVDFVVNSAELWEINSNGIASKLSQIKPQNCEIYNTVISFINPSNANTGLDFKINSIVVQEDVSVILHNSSGKCIFDSILNLKEGLATINQNIIFIPGIYYLTIKISNKEAYTHKIVRI